MISKVDLHDFWEITRALYGNDRTSDGEMAVVLQLLDAVSTDTVTTSAVVGGSGAAPAPKIAA